LAKAIPETKLGKSLKGLFTTESILPVDVSMNNKNLPIYASSGEEFFNGCDNDCDFLQVPSENLAINKI
jgi:hypothetical protein